MKNNPQKSLRVKVGRIVTGFSFVMVVFYTFMLLQLKDSGLRDATHSVLIHEAQLFIDAYQRDPNTPLPQSYSLQGFIGEENLPPAVTRYFPLELRDRWHRRKSGIYYTVADEERYFSHHHLLIETLPNSQQEFFLYYRLSTDKRQNHDIWENVRQVAYAGFALVIIMLMVLRKFIHRAFSPLDSLSKWINNLSVGAKPSALPEDIQDDEIGQLAQNLFHALDRINAYNERERAFLRNASHELRTPIAIIRNTMDVLEHKKQRLNYPMELEIPLQRIRRASDTMKAVTEAILWLAVEEYSAPSTQTTNLRVLVEEIIEENKNLVENKDITIECNLTQLGSICIEHTLAYITIDNLIRNAFQHCCGGTIRISAVSPRAIEIANSRYNTLDSQKSEVATGGFGLGLALVQNIAAKKRWEFSFAIENDYAVACLEFTSRDDVEKLPS